MARWRVTDQDGDEDEYDAVTRLSYLSDVDSVVALAKIFNDHYTIPEFTIIDDRTLLAVWEHDFIEKYERLDD